MGSILCQAAANDTNPVYVNKLLRAFNAEQPIDEKAIKTEIASENSMVEPLSEREIEVLQCIAEGLSNRDIAQRLMISLSTVKSHTRSIYGKLEVNSRTQAVARAKSWGILPSS